MLGEPFSQSPTRAAFLRIRHRRRGIPLALLLVTALVAGLLLALTGSPAQAAGTLLSQGRPATASSAENATFPASAAVDGDPGTRWSSAFTDPQWLEVDLGSSQTISQVVLSWETAAAKAYQIQTSADGTTWTSIYSTTAGPGGTETLNVTGTGGTQTIPVSGIGRYLRMYGTARATQYGYSLFELQAFAGATP